MPLWRLQEQMHLNLFRLSCSSYLSAKPQQFIVSFEVGIKT